ncbi:MAG: hypothetical protein KGS73_01275 [Chloroflexi bacterium]|nr:hypothetical protein [Chloroflexota bacterium]
MSVTVTITLTGEVNLFWGRIQAALNEAERFDDRYLLVTAVEPVRPEGASLSPYRRVTRQEDASASRLHSIHWIGPFARRIDQTLTQILSFLFDFQRAKSRFTNPYPRCHRGHPPVGATLAVARAVGHGLILGTRL